MPKTAVVLLAEGFEEIEAIAPVDILRRAGIRVTLAGVSSPMVKSSRDVGVQSDEMLKDIKDLPDAVIVPGGLPGSVNLAKSAETGDFLRKMNRAGKLIAAICAAPSTVLSPLGILDGKRATCYPGCEADFSPAVRYSSERVVADGSIITSQGPGTAMEFGLAIVTFLAGKEVAGTLREKMLIKV
ncbi:MAG: Chaperone protein YajL [Candidatus Omnitrophica bacterium ADurb.Bin277]|nr:MAG: Chaperone protein YajL [Candidatus Omnitrophica bacterium ADurb.Bin277]